MKKITLGFAVFTAVFASADSFARYAFNTLVDDAKNEVHHGMDYVDNRTHKISNAVENAQQSVRRVSGAVENAAENVQVQSLWSDIGQGVESTVKGAVHTVDVTTRPARRAVAPVTDPIKRAGNRLYRGSRVKRIHNAVEDAEQVHGVSNAIEDAE